MNVQSNPYRMATQSLTKLKPKSQSAAPDQAVQP